MGRGFVRTHPGRTRTPCRGTSNKARQRREASLEATLEAFEVSGGRGGKLLLTNLSCFLYNLFYAFDSDQFAKGLVVCVFKGKDRSCPLFTNHSGSIYCTRNANQSFVNRTETKCCANRGTSNFPVSQIFLP